MTKPPPALGGRLTLVNTYEAAMDEMEEAGSDGGATSYGCADHIGQRSQVGWCSTVLQKEWLHCAIGVRRAEVGLKWWVTAMTSPSTFSESWTFCAKVIPANNRGTSTQKYSHLQSLFSTNLTDQYDQRVRKGVF